MSALAVLEELLLGLDRNALTRAALRDRFRNKALELDSIAGVFLFGSAGRGEFAQDLDLLMVVDAPTIEHRYERRVINAMECDLNVVSSAWIDSCWRDPEWGYWLTESFPLATSCTQLLEKWQDSANRYWTLHARRERYSAFSSMFAKLAYQARLAAATFPLVSRFLTHEAIRVALIATIDRHGTRPFSHRTFVLESTKSAGIAGFSLELLMPVLCPLPERYVSLRAWISGLLRSDLVAQFGFQRGDAMSIRIDRLCHFANVDIEDELDRRDGDEWFAAAANSELALKHAEDMLAAVAPRVSVRRSDSSPTSIPQLNASHGIRWQDYSHGRLKLIVGTGGCRTPTCRFCSLPAYGRIAGRFRMDEIRTTLREVQPTTLSLYNDGSLLNPEEISPAEIEVLCDSLQIAGVRHLEIESIPRFVFSEGLNRIRDRAELETLSISMGLQAAGNAFAVAELGRPDIDAVFDRAIVESMESGARVRLYLLWGFGTSTHAHWERQLGESIEWARARGVNRVTICPFISNGSEMPALEDGLCALRSTLFRLQTPSDGSVDVSLPDRPSCGIRYADDRCVECEEILVSKTWGQPGTCSPPQEVILGPN